MSSVPLRVSRELAVEGLQTKRPVAVTSLDLLPKIML